MNDNERKVIVGSGVDVMSSVVALAWCGKKERKMKRKKKKEKENEGKWGAGGSPREEEAFLWGKRSGRREKIWKKWGKLVCAL